MAVGCFVYKNNDKFSSVAINLLEERTGLYV